MTIYSGFSYWKRWFSIVMLVYQRVICFLFLDCCFCAFWWPFDQQNWRLTEIILFNILQSKNHCIWIKHNQTLADYRGGSKNVGSEIVGAARVQGSHNLHNSGPPVGIAISDFSQEKLHFFQPPLEGVGWGGDHVHHSRVSLSMWVMTSILGSIFSWVCKFFLGTVP